MKRERAIALLLVLSLCLLCFAGCGSTSETAEESSAVQESASASTSEDSVSSEPSEEATDEAPATEADASEAESATEGTEEGADGAVDTDESAPTNAYYSEHIGVVDYTLPLFEEEYTVSLFWVLLSGMGGATTQYKQDLLFWERVQEHTGVTIEFTEISDTVGSEQYNLMIVSGEMTDLIYEANCTASGSTTPYTGGYDKAIEDDIYLDLTDLIPEYAPNYYAILQDDADLLRDLSTDTGKLYSVAMIYDEPVVVNMGPLVRSDFLEATGLDVPATTEDWMEAFAAMKANGVKYPFGVSSGGDLIGNMFSYAFGTSGGHAFKVDLATETLVYDGTSDELRNFIEYFNEAFEAGYVDPDYPYTPMFDNSLMLAGETALMGGVQKDLMNYRDSYGIELQAVALTYPEGYEAPIMRSHATRLSSGQDMVITTSCEEPEKALKFLDWFYSTDGASAVVFGFNEGESYEVVDGVKQWLPFMTGRNEDSVEYEIIYALDEGPGVQIVNKKNAVYPDYAVEALSLWQSADRSLATYEASPTLYFTSEESEAISAIESDISTYTATEITKFMMGVSELTDETWAAYCQQVESMGISTLLEYYNVAYGRYLAR